MRNKFHCQGYLGLFIVLWYCGRYSRGGTIRPQYSVRGRSWYLFLNYYLYIVYGITERKVLQCIFGAKQENGTWRKRYSYELYEIFNEPNIVKYVKFKILAWAGHLVRMNSDRTLNTFAASYLNTQGLNNSCLKSPASTLVDLTFQLRALCSFSLNQLRNLSL